MKPAALILTAALFLGGCGSLSDSRLEDARHMAAGANLNERLVPAGPFMLTVFERVNKPGATADLYIEGDGLAWVDRHMPSRDPSPVNPVALALAAEDTAPNVIYMARPCQYSRMQTPDACAEKYWTSARFSPEVIAAMNSAMDDIKKRYAVSGFHLVGFSGGAAVAVLVAARRHDVQSIRTVAGNLDTGAFSQLHHVSPLAQSLNPLSVAARIAHIPQQHFIGGADEIITPQIAANFVKASVDARCIHVTEIASANHEAGWKEAWPRLLEISPACRD